MQSYYILGDTLIMKREYKFDTIRQETYLVSKLVKRCNTHKAAIAYLARMNELGNLEDTISRG